MYTYIHLPFCASHCIYCDFAIVKKGSSKEKADYLNALLEEISTTFQRTPKPLNDIKSLYFGGGTPSRYKAPEIQQILDCIRQFTSISAQAEINFEMNPEAFESEPQEYLSLGINRFSVGIQSLQANELKRLSRIHSPQQAIEFIKKLHQAGAQNISIDLMHGIPEQTPKSWQNTLEQVTQLPIQHISAYGLQVEEGTPLDKLVHQGKMTIPDEDKQVAFYEITQKVLNQAGFYQYEISNYAKPGFESKHNLNYWNQGEFYGFGLGAHGYVNQQRYANTDSLNTYLNQTEKKQTTEIVSDDETLQNTLIFGLRLNQGVSLTTLEEKYDKAVCMQILECIETPLKQGLIQYENERLTLTPKGQLLSNIALEPLLSLKLPVQTKS